MANDDVTEITILGNFLGFYMKFFQNLRGLMRGLRSVELRKRRSKGVEDERTRGVEEPG